MRFFIVFAALMALATPSIAQDYKTVLDLPTGQALVNLSATERVEIEQDLLTAHLRFQSENKSAKKLQDDINEVMKKALHKAKGVKTVKASTTQYNVYERYQPRTDKDVKPEKIWQGQQGIQLKSTHAEDLLELTGDLQALGMSMSGLNYSVSPDLLEETRDSLLEAALAKLSAKATRIAKALGKKSSDLVEINVDMGGYRPSPQPRMMMSKGMAISEMAMDAPVAQAGQSDVSVTVSARAILKP